MVGEEGRESEVGGGVRDREGELGLHGHLLQTHVVVHGVMGRGGRGTPAQWNKRNDYLYTCIQSGFHLGGLMGGGGALLRNETREVIIHTVRVSSGSWGAGEGSSQTA